MQLSFYVRSFPILLDTTKIEKSHLVDVESVFARRESLDFALDRERLRLGLLEIHKFHS